MLYISMSVYDKPHKYPFSSVQSLSYVRLFVTPRIAAREASLSITIPRSSLRLTSIESMMPSSHLILGRPLLLLPPIPPSIRVFSNESTLHMRWPKDWSFSFIIIPSKEIPGLISFRMDWLDLLAVQGTLHPVKYSTSPLPAPGHLAHLTPRVFLSVSPVRFPGPGRTGRTVSHQALSGSSSTSFHFSPFYLP